MTYQDHYEAFKRRHTGNPDGHLAYALNDCHEALKANRGREPTDPYLVKLWAEIDAIRDVGHDRQRKKIAKHRPSMAVFL